MARRTREQKIQAQERRERQLLRSVQTPVTRPKAPAASIGSAPSNKLSKDSSAPLPYFRQDLTRSLILTVAIIALEIGLYYGNLYTYLGTK